MWESSRELAVAVKSLKIKKGQQEPGQHSSATFSHEFLYYKKIFIYFLSLCHQFLWVEHFHHRWATRRPSPLPSLFLKTARQRLYAEPERKTVLVFIFSSWIGEDVGQPKNREKERKGIALLSPV
jgi:hypothetical protein